MELILISDSKLKIMLSKSDMQNYSITNECMSYENTDTRKMFGKLLDEANAKVGFDSKSGKVFIQVYPSKNGGCEVYITTERAENAQAKKKTNTPRKKKEYCFYRFDCLNEIIELCKVLKESEYDLESFVCVEQEGRNEKYYLVLQEEVFSNPQISKKKCINKSDLANEYGKRIERKEMMQYIKEHTKNVVSSDAVGILCKL